MVVPETFEGILNGAIWFHYDAAGDVLYLRLVSDRDAEALGEETSDGLILLRRSSDDAPVGLTVVNWWKRFGRGAVPDSMQAFAALLAPLAGRIAA